MADHLVDGCLFTVRTTNLMEILVDEPCSTTVEQTMKRGLFEIDRKASTSLSYCIASSSLNLAEYVKYRQRYGYY